MMDILILHMLNKIVKYFLHGFWLKIVGPHFHYCRLDNSIYVIRNVNFPLQLLFAKTPESL